MFLIQLFRDDRGSQMFLAILALATIYVPVAANLDESHPLHVSAYACLLYTSPSPRDRG